jgi:methionyl-tRNA synthetase
MALGEPLPGTMYIHSYWVRDGKKMSKSLGNFVDLGVLRAYADRYSVDALRWYLLTQGPLGNTDTDFGYAKFVEVYNADLANGIGNCASRVANMIQKYFVTLPDPGSSSGHLAEFNFPGLCASAVARAHAHAGAMDLAGIAREGGEIVKRIDAFINVTAPFKLAKLIDAEPARKGELAGILYACAEAIRVASIILSPIMPTKMRELWTLWNIPTPPSGVPLSILAEFGGAHALKPGQAITKGEALFMRADAALPEPVAAM